MPRRDSLVSVDPLSITWIVIAFVMILHHDVDTLFLASGNKPVGAIETISDQSIARL